VIFEKAGADGELHGMGTTLCALRVVPGADGEGDELAWINVGDSRVYLYRDDQLIQLSRDHSLVEDLLRDGQLTEEEAAVHPKRNIITRALGIDVDVDVDGSTVIPFTGDRFLLCSDGLFGEVSNDQIAAVLRRLADPTEAADELVRLANEAGGRDNITVVIVEVVDDGGRSAAAAEIWRPSRPA
jgi:PPM family protein phosphatase